MKLPRVTLTTSSVANLFGALIVGYLLIVLGQTIKHNYDLDTQISGLRSQIDNLKTEKSNLSYDISYYQTESFRDRQARSQLGLQQPGENVVIFPSASPTPLPRATKAAADVSAQSPLRQWLRFLTGRP